MSSSFTCEPIDLDDRTVGIDRYEVLLQAISLDKEKQTAASNISSDQHRGRQSLHGRKKRQTKKASNLSFDEQRGRRMQCLQTILL
jgi:hypothetical protein